MEALWSSALSIILSVGFCQAATYNMFALPCDAKSLGYQSCTILVEIVSHIHLAFELKCGTAHLRMGFFLLSARLPMPLLRLTLLYACL